MKITEKLAYNDKGFRRALLSPLLFLELLKFPLPIPVLFKNIPKFLEDFRREGFSDFDFSKYSVRRGFMKCDSRKDREGRYYYGDTLFQFALKYDGLYGAVLGFSLLDSKTAIIP